jgi:hypothetical protein
MKRRLTWAAIALAAVVAITAGTAAASNGTSHRTIRVEEEQCTAPASACSFVDLGAPGSSQGDVLVFSVPLLSHGDGDPVGHVIGHCTVTDPASGASVCEAVATLHGGTLALEGIFHPGGTSRFAVTGGTGRYAAARGEFTLTAALPTNHGVIRLIR